MLPGRGRIRAIIVITVPIFPGRIRVNIVKGVMIMVTVMMIMVKMIMDMTMIMARTIMNMTMIMARTIMNMTMIMARTIIMVGKRIMAAVRVILMIVRVILAGALAAAPVDFFGLHLIVFLFEVSHEFLGVVFVELRQERLHIEQAGDSVIANEVLLAPSLDFACSNV